MRPSSMFGRRAAADQADIVGQLVLAELAAERVDDPRQLVDRAIVRVHDAARMAGAAAGDERPAVGAAPGDRAHVLAVLLRQPFEVERDVGPLAGLDQRPARDLDRIARIFLVAGEHDRDVGTLQRAGGLHRAERGDHHRHAALVVARAGTDRRGCPCRSQRWNGRVRLEHGVEMRRSAACACRGRCPCGGRRCGRRGRRPSCRPSRP